MLHWGHRKLVKQNSHRVYRIKSLTLFTRDNVIFIFKISQYLQPLTHFINSCSHVCSQTPEHFWLLRWDSWCPFCALWRMELMVSVTVHCAPGSCWWQQTTSHMDIFYPLGVRSCFLRVLCSRIWLTSASISLQWRLMLLVFFLVWNIHLFKATVCFPVGLTGNGMTCVMWHNPAGTLLFEAQAVLLVRHLCWSLIRVRASWPWHKHSCFILVRSALCYQSKPF